MVFKRFSTELILSRMSLSSFSTCSSLIAEGWFAGRKGEGRGSIGRSGSKGLFGSIVVILLGEWAAFTVFYRDESSRCGLVHHCLPFCRFWSVIVTNALKNARG